MSVFLDDDQVSCTVTFDPLTEGPKLPAALDIFQYQLKGVSFLPQLEQGAFAQVRRGTRRRGIHTQLFWVVGGVLCCAVCRVPTYRVPCAVCRVLYMVANTKSPSFSPSSSFPSSPSLHRCRTRRSRKTGTHRSLRH